MNAVTARLALVIAMMLWGSSFIALKYAFAFYPPMLVILCRMILASICFLLVRKRLRGNRYQRGDWKLLGLMCLFDPCLYFVSEGMALNYTSAAQAGMITAMMPLIVAVLARIFLAERIHGRTLFGFALAVSGAIWLSAAAQPSQHATHPILGNGLELLAACSGAAYSIMLKKLSARYNTVFLTAMQGFVGSGFFMLLVPLSPWPEHFDTLATVAVVYLGVGVTLGAYLLFNLALVAIPITQASAFTNLIPVFTLFFAMILLGETLSTAQWWASAVILGGVILSQLPHKKSAPLTTASPPSVS